MDADATTLTPKHFFNGLLAADRRVRPRRVDLHDAVLFGDPRAGGRAGKLATVAAECGYADQSHLTRDWRQFAGTTPSAWIAGELPFVQDTGTDDQAS